MNVIVTVNWDLIKPSWESWRGFKKDDPVPLKNYNPDIYISSKLYDEPFFPVKSFGLYSKKGLLGCARVYYKITRDHIKIGGVGNVSIHPLYRRNGLCDKLMKTCIIYMKHVGFDVSILWATVLNVYEKHGYISIGGTNLMYRPIINFPENLTVERIMNISKELGTW